MKLINILCLFLLILSPAIGNSQLPYTLTTSTQTFQYLSNPTIMPWATSQLISWPFSFNMFSSGFTTATVNISNDCFIDFGGKGILPLSAGLNMLNSSTQTAYEVTGSSPSRILKLEWKNHGFSNTAAANDSITIQIWLYETSNIIEWHFGTNYWYTGSFPSSLGPFVLLVNGSTYYNIAGAPSSPTFSACGLGCHLSGIPVAGKVYTLTPNAVTTISEKETDGDIFILYPNPSYGRMSIISETKEDKRIEVFNSSGQNVFKCTLTDSSSDIDISDQPGGIYFIKMYSKAGFQIKKIVLQ